MNKLVELVKGQVLTTSLIFAEEFELNHRDLLVKIRDLTAKYPAVKKEFKESNFTNNRNRDYQMFYITRDGYLILIMNTSAKGKSQNLLFQKKLLFIQAFNKLEELVLQEMVNKKNTEWITTREQGKSIRIELTDTIKDFVEYAKKQGSKNADRYYSNITKMEYKALGYIQEVKPELRNTLDSMQLYQILLAEDLVKRQIIKYMSENIHYKEIYILIKQDVINFAESLLIKQIKE